MISENDLDDFQHPVESTGVAIGNKHAYKKVVIKDDISSSENLRVGRVGHEIGDPSPSSVISDKAVAFENGGGSHGPESEIGSSRVSDGVETPVGKAMGPSKSLDKINNLVQKEIALARVKVTREKAYGVIAAALDAHKWMDVVDRQGNVKQEWVPDLDKQRWGCEMALKAFGDLIERKEIEYDVGDKTLDRLRSLSVSELKSRAADILLGKKTSIVEAEIVK